MSRILAISDIHGHIKGVQMLLDAAQYTPGTDQLVLLGDFIDKDPTTWGSLEFISQLTKEGAQAISGNMELRLYENAWNHRGMEIPIDDSLINFIHSLPLYLDYLDYLFVHAGIRPGVKLAAQIPTDLTEIRQDFWETPYPFSKPIVFGHTPTHLIGAKPGEIWTGPGIVGIDTGAKHGLRLTLLDLTGHMIYSCSTDRQHMYDDLRISVWSGVK